MMSRAAIVLALALSFVAAVARGMDDPVLEDIDEEAKVPPAALPAGASAKSANTGAGQDRIAVSPDGTRVATSGKDGQIHVYDANSAKLLFAFKAHEGNCDDVEFSADGKTLFSGGADMTVREWNLETRKEVRKFEGHTGEIRNVAASIDGRLLASSDTAGTIRIWDLSSGKELHKMQGHGIEFPPGVNEQPPTPTIDALSFSPDSRTLLSEADDETARLWDVVKGERIRIMPKHDGSVAAISIAPDGARAASTRGGERCPTRSTVRVWSVGTGKMQRMLVGHAADITCLTFSPDSRYVFTGARDRTIRQWESESGLELRRWTLQSVATGIAASPDGSQIVSVSPREGVVVWKLNTAPVYAAHAAGVGDTWDAQWKNIGRPPDEAPASYDLRAAAFAGLLKHDPSEIVKELERRLTEAPSSEDTAAVKKAIDDLDDDNYSIRLEAAEALQKLGNVARTHLVAALDSPSPEVRVAAAQILKAIGGPYDIRVIMVCELLPIVGTPAARDLLASIATRSIPEASHARAVLKRWPAK